MKNLFPGSHLFALFSALIFLATVTTAGKP